MALPKPTMEMLKRIAAETPHTQAEIIGWFPEEPEQAAAAFSLAIEARAVERISGKDDADVHARWAVSVQEAYRAMAEESAKASAGGS
jgi:hypothetical protein